MSPERLGVHKGYHLLKSDVWSIGVTAYEMLCGRRCFYGKNDRELCKKIASGDWQWPQSLKLSHRCKDFIEVYGNPFYLFFLFVCLFVFIMFLLVQFVLCLRGCVLCVGVSPLSPRRQRDQKRRGHVTFDVSLLCFKRAPLQRFHSQGFKF